MYLKYDEFVSKLSEFATLLSNQVTPTPQITEIKRSLDNELYIYMMIQTKGYIETTISYHHIYQVPVIHFRPLSKKDPAELGDDEFESVPTLDLSIKSMSRAVSSQYLKEVTLSDHHLLSQPWFLIHPCESFSFMGQFEFHNDEMMYLISWFSIYSGILNLRLDTNSLPKQST